MGVQRPLGQVSAGCHLAACRSRRRHVFTTAAGQVYTHKALHGGAMHTRATHTHKYTVHCLHLSRTHTTTEVCLSVCGTPAVGGRPSRHRQRSAASHPSREHSHTLPLCSYVQLKKTNLSGPCHYCRTSTPVCARTGPHPPKKNPQACRHPTTWTGC